MQLAPFPSATGNLGSAVSSPSGVRGGAQAAKRFSGILEAPDGLSWNLWRPSPGGHGFLGPLNPPMGSRSVVSRDRQTTPHLALLSTVRGGLKTHFRVQRISPELIY